MPKIVDHEQRKKRIVQATWQVILDKGVEGASVRNIAAEAGVSLGALRHYFSTQDELLVYAMKLVNENVINRVSEIALKDLSPREKVYEVLLEIVPTTDEKMAEMEVWFAFVAYSRQKEEFRILRQGIYTGIVQMMDFLKSHGELKDGQEHDLETEMLYSFIDGLALHSMLEPERLKPDRIEKTLRRYLDRILK
ncbi:TetR/AcrR family transcriptional regulator [Bacillus infantis]|uniref:TetR family transcriptional regulator n=1 Tax=Bacillus infantis TaxID=324767 RepID=A0A5D4RD12_9BACI|nr:TetR family transcriptional regulator C-terminal domain-containing protein [Bacillus infantis]TYS47776.1 TetR family transcriptional regulator [Bacillus infantis]